MGGLIGGTPGYRDEAGRDSEPVFRIARWEDARDEDRAWPGVGRRVVAAGFDAQRVEPFHVPGRHRQQPHLVSRWDAHRFLHTGCGRVFIRHLPEARDRQRKGGKSLFQSGRFMLTTDWSTDGRLIAYAQQAAQTSFDLWLLPLTGGTQARCLPADSVQRSGGQVPSRCGRRTAVDGVSVE